MLEARVEKLYNDSTAAKIMRLVESANENKSESVHFVDKFTKYYTPIVILIALLTVILPPMMFVEAKAEWIYRGLIILVAACPCGLMVSIPLAFLGGIGSASKQGVLIKSGAVLEDLIRVDTYVFDKTGTLTEGVFHVKDIVPYKFEKERLLELAALAESYSKHPVALSLAEAYGKPAESTRIKDVKEEPGYGVHAFVDGLEVYAGNTRLMNREGILYAQTEKDGTAVHVAVDGKYAGYILIADTIRKDTGKLMRWMRKKNMGTVMLTGDNERTAKAIGAQAGVDEVIAGVLPEGKEAEIRKLKEQGKVAMVGDGINDAPALTRADIGIAIGAGADVAIDAADVVLMKSRLSDVPAAVRLSRATLRNIHENLFWAFFYIIIGIPLAAGVWIPIFGWTLNPMFGALAMSLSSFCVVSNALRLNLFKVKDSHRDHKIKNEVTLPQWEASKGEKNMTKTMTIKGMMCGHCEARVKKTLEELEHVSEAQVSHEKGTAVVCMETEVADEVLKKAVEDQGYQVENIQ